MAKYKYLQPVEFRTIPTAEWRKGNFLYGDEWFCRFTVANGNGGLFGVERENIRPDPDAPADSLDSLKKAYDDLTDKHAELLLRREELLRVIGEQKEQIATRDAWIAARVLADKESK